MLILYMALKVVHNAIILNKEGCREQPEGTAGDGGEGWFSSAPLFSAGSAWGGQEW